MKRSITSPLAAACLALVSQSHAQNGLTDIPDTDVEAELRSFTLPKGAKINLFASEPAVVSPTQMNWDRRGRLWVACSSLYPHIKPGQKDQDRIVILEDTNGDGVADKSTDFATNLYIPTAVLPGDGGAYVADANEVLFLRDTDGDDVADEREVVLSGFGTEDTHHLVHTFRWGPEGMIWLNQSIYIHTHLETPYGIRRLLGGGMWHYRPETQRAEVYMMGLFNPWGHVFDKWGQSFLSDGAGYDGISFVFPRAVFKGFPGASRFLTGLNPGQPKHCGLEILDGAHVPSDLHGLFAAADFRGNRINLFKFTDSGSSYLSTQQADLLSSSHRAFRPIDVKMGPDGAIYVGDWYNPIIQHGEVDFRDPRRDHSHGRIWRITFEDTELAEAPEYSQLDDASLVALLNDPAGLTRQLATVEMRARDTEAMLDALSHYSAFDDVDPELARLRYVWATQAVNRFDADAAAALTEAENHKARAGALRAIYYGADSNDQALQLGRKAVADPNPQVRLWGVSVLAQLDSPETVPIALSALDVGETDQTLDFALWSIAREHSDRWTDQAEDGNPFGNLRQLLFAVRAVEKPVAASRILEALRSGELATDSEVAAVADWIGKVGEPEHLEAIFEFSLSSGATPGQQIAVLNALSSAAQLRQATLLGDESRLSRFLRSRDEEIFAAAASLAGLWELDSARDGLAQAFLDASGNVSRARAAMSGLVDLGGEKTISFFKETARADAASFQLRSLAVIGLTRVDPAEGAQVALDVLRAAPSGQDPYGIFEAFLANVKGPAALASALEGESLPQPIALAGMQSASGAATSPEELIEALRRAGDLKPMKLALSGSEMEQMMGRVANEGDPHRGERVYRRPSLQCSVCHAIGGTGGIIGPDLVSIGASAPTDYLIDSLLQPSVKIKEGYHTTLVTLKNGNSIAGAIAREDANELVVRDATGRENRIAKSDIASQVISPVSLMPPGLTAQLREDEFVDLVSFLSELGKDGDFKTEPNRYVRQWQALEPHERTRDAIGFYGNKIFTEEIDSYDWGPFYATVAGGLPADEMPDVRGRGSNRFAVGRTVIEALEAGPLRFQVRGKLDEMDLFVDDTEVALPDSGESAEVEIEITESGRHRLTLVGQKNHGLDKMSLELLDDASRATLIEATEF